MSRDTQAGLPEALRRKAQSEGGNGEEAKECGSKELFRIKCQEGDVLFAEAKGIRQSSDDMMLCWDPESLKSVVLALHKYQAAIAAYSEALEVIPTSTELLFKRATCYECLEDWSPCQEDMQQAVQLRPDFVAAWALLARALWRGGSPQAGRRRLSAGLQHNPGNAELMDLKSLFVLDLAELKVQHPTSEIHLREHLKEPSTPSTAVPSHVSTPSGSCANTPCMQAGLQVDPFAESPSRSQKADPAMAVSKATSRPRSSSRASMKCAGLPQVGATSPARMMPKDVFAKPAAMPFAKESPKSRSSPQMPCTRLMLPPVK